MAFLNGRKPYRFTAIYVIHGEMMRNTHFYDRVGGHDLGALREVPLMDSLCQYVFREGSFVTLNSAVDSRLDGHPYQRVVLSFVLLPLLDHAGQLFGTFCHLVFEPRPPDDEEFEFLQRAMRLLPSFLL